MSEKEFLKFLKNYRITQLYLMVMVTIAVVIQVLTLVQWR